MAIGVTNSKSGGNTTDTTNYSVTSVVSSPVMIVACAMRGISADVAITCSGLSATWNVVTHLWDTTAQQQLYVWWSVNATGTGTVNLGNTNGATSALWSFNDLTGVNTSQPIVAGSTKTSVGTSDNTLTLPTLNAPSNPKNRPFAVFCNWNSVAGQAAPRTNWTELTDTAINTDAEVLQVQWRSDTFETTSSVTWTGGPYQDAGIAFELRAQDTTRFLSFF